MKDNMQDEFVMADLFAVWKSMSPEALAQLQDIHAGKFPKFGEMIVILSSQNLIEWAGTEKEDRWRLTLRGVEILNIKRYFDVTELYNRIPELDRLLDQLAKSMRGRTGSGYLDEIFRLEREFTMAVVKLRNSI